jgi:hypothetical protein
MASSHVRQLDLGEDQVMMAIDFHEAYARLVLDEAQERPMQHQTDASQDERWTALVDAASALREAGQWAMLLDQERGQALLREAGRIFHRLEYGFGAFLRVAVADPTLSVRDMRRGVQQLAVLHDETMERQSSTEIPSPLYHPQQQAYLLLAASGMAERLGPLRERAGALAEGSPQRLGVLPMGALGAPVRLYWEVARVLLHPGPSTAAVIARHLSELCLGYARRIPLAMANQRLWNHAAAPVDVVDVDIIGIVAVSAQRLGLEMMGTALRAEIERLPELARMPLELAIDIAEHPPSWYTEGPLGES